MDKHTDIELNEQDIVKMSKSLLDQSAEELDQTTLIKLQAVRKRAVGKAKSESRIPVWLVPAGGLATAAIVAVLTVSLWWSSPEQYQISPVLDDLALLSESEELEFFEELEFYEWLEEEKDVS